jgi:hypothetical protein
VWPERSFDFEGKKVDARVIQAKPLASGAIEVTVQTSCPHPDGQIHHQTNTLTLTDPSGGIQLESAMHDYAAWLHKLCWRRPRIIVFVARLKKADGEFLNLNCAFNVTQARTTIEPWVLEIAALPQVDTFRPAENPAIQIPVHRAVIEFGKREFEVDAVAATNGSMCVIGADLVLNAVKDRPELLFDLFLTDIVRALGSAARAKQRTVLVLGSYRDEGRKKLSTIRRVLDESGLEAVTLDDFGDIHQQSVFEKMLMFGSLARFIVCDESEASGHLIELKACADIGFVTALLRPQGKSPTWMNADIAKDRAYMRAIAYETDEDLSKKVLEAVEWAESKIRERADYYNQEYPWRYGGTRSLGY